MTQAQSFDLQQLLLIMMCNKWKIVNGEPFSFWSSVNVLLSSALLAKRAPLSFAKSAFSRRSLAISEEVSSKKIIEHGSTIMYYYYFFIVLGTQFPRAKNLVQIVKLYVCLGWSKNWAGRLLKE